MLRTTTWVLSIGIFIYLTLTFLFETNGIFIAKTSLEFMTVNAGDGALEYEQLASYKDASSGQKILSEDLSPESIYGSKNATDIYAYLYLNNNNYRQFVQKINNLSLTGFGRKIDVLEELYPETSTPLGLYLKNNLMTPANMNIAYVNPEILEKIFKANMRMYMRTLKNNSSSVNSMSNGLLEIDINNVKVQINEPKVLQWGSSEFKQITHMYNTQPKDANTYTDLVVFLPIEFHVKAKYVFRNPYLYKLVPGGISTDYVYKTWYYIVQ